MHLTNLLLQSIDLGGGLGHIVLKILGLLLEADPKTRHLVSLLVKPDQQLVVTLQTVSKLDFKFLDLLKTLLFFQLCLF